MKSSRWHGIVVSGVLFSVSLDAAAACVCRCVNGNVQAICQSAIDVQPICSPQVCPVVPPSVAPIQAPRVPPVGTKTCNQEQIFNPNTSKYEWRTVCR
jgi:hypothetical protein